MGKSCASAMGAEKERTNCINSVEAVLASGTYRNIPKDSGKQLEQKVHALVGLAVD